MTVTNVEMTQMIAKMQAAVLVIAVTIDGKMQVTAQVTAQVIAVTNVEM